MRLFSFSSGSALPYIALAIITPLTFTGCGSSAFSGAPTTKVAAAVLASDSGGTTADALQENSVTPPVLLFNGTGTTSSTVSAVEAILNTLKLAYATANSSQMNAMTETKLKSYKLLIVPGGNSITIGKSLTKTATTNIHNAVEGGLHYLGICAGGFFGGYSIYNGLNLTGGVWFNLYNGTKKQVADVRFPDNTVYDIYEEDGPELAGWGSIVGEYSDGKPAIVEGKLGTGWVILSGVHPEAPASWREGMNFSTPLATDLAYAGKLVTNALNGTSLPHF